MALDWDDLRIFLAATRAGSLKDASRRLGVDAATVGRRIGRLESALKSTLLIRSKSGLELTAAGARIREIALEAEASMNAVDAVSTVGSVAGVVRVSAAEGFGTTLLAPAMAELHARHPNLRLELAAHAGFLSPTRREVDMAVTLSAPAETRLVVEHLTGYQLALYGAPAYLSTHELLIEPADLRRHTLVGYVEDLIYAPQLRYLQEIHPDLTPHLSSSSIRAQREIIASGAGIGVLPCFMADGLTRLLPEVLITRAFWLGIHRDVAGTARARAVRTWIEMVVQSRRPALAPYPQS
jgi:DNA-binding transcriptional LysR family regulator